MNELPELFDVVALGGARTHRHAHHGAAVEDGAGDVGAAGGVDGVDQRVGRGVAGQAQAHEVQRCRRGEFAAIVGGDLAIASNNQSNVVVSVSRDSGQTFTTPYLLVHPAPSGGTSYPYPRIETAAHTAGPMLLLQQYVDNSAQRLLLFSVPLP